jgi:hypothetical protein
MLSQGIGSTRSIQTTRSVATHIQHCSYMELLYEQDRPEPRLSRVLAHGSVYENASRWCEQNLRVSRNATNKSFQLSGPQQQQQCYSCCPDRKTVDTQLQTSITASILRVRTLSQLQGLINLQAQLKEHHLVTVSAVAVCSERNSDSDYDSDSSGTSSEEDDDDYSDSHSNPESNSSNSIPDAHRKKLSAFDDELAGTFEYIEDINRKHQDDNANTITANTEIAIR